MTPPHCAVFSRCRNKEKLTEDAAEENEEEHEEERIQK